jgi:hypothetical protein
MHCVTKTHFLPFKTYSLAEETNVNVGQTDKHCLDITQSVNRFIVAKIVLYC